MLKAVELENKKVIFLDQETGKKFLFTYISSITNKESYFCKKSFEISKEQLEKNGLLERINN